MQFVPVIRPKGEVAHMLMWSCGHAVRWWDGAMVRTTKSPNLTEGLGLGLAGRCLGPCDW